MTWARLGSRWIRLCQCAPGQIPGQVSVKSLPTVTACELLLQLGAGQGLADQQGQARWGPGGAWGACPDGAPALTCSTFHVFRCSGGRRPVAARRCEGVQAWLLTTAKKGMALGQASEFRLQRLQPH